MSSVLIGLDTRGPLRRRGAALAGGQSLARRRFEIVGVSRAGAPGVRPGCSPTDAAPGAFSRALRLATDHRGALRDALTEFPPGFLDCTVASFAGEGSSAASRW